MAPPKGHPRYGGRQKGTPNKVTKGIREAWDEAIAVAQGTPGYSLAEWAVSSREANEKFWLATTKMIPREMKLDATVSIAEVIAAARERARKR